MLRFDDIKPSDAQKLREILEVINFVDSIRRLEDVRAYVDFIKDKNLEPPEKSLAFEFFDYAVQAHLYGFDHATIYYAALAAELALVAKVGEVLPYRKLVDRARNWLNESQIRHAIELNSLRDCYMHYQNLHLFTQARNAEIAKAMSSFEELSDIDKEQILCDIQVLDEMHKRRFPVLWSASPYLSRYEAFLRQREQTYMEWLRRRGIGAVSFLRDLIKYPRGPPWYDRRAYDAFHAIEMSYRILAALDAFEKV